MPWFVTIFFGLVAGVALVHLFGSNYLYLGADGFEQNMLGRKLSCRWDEVSNFGTYTTHNNSFVTFDRVQDEGKMMTKLNRAIGGGSTQLGDTFGLSAPALVRLMQKFQQRAILHSQGLVADGKEKGNF